MLIGFISAVIQALGGSDVNHANIDGSTALGAAAFDGHVAAVKVLLEAGAEVNHADNNRCTALYFGARHGHVEVIQVLLAAGADPSIADHQGRTPLALARANRFEAAAMALVQEGACAACGGGGSASGAVFMKCARCKAVRYCSKDCQRTHWRLHKASCAAETAQTGGL